MVCSENGAIHGVWDNEGDSCSRFQEPEKRREIRASQSVNLSPTLHHSMIDPCLLNMTPSLRSISRIQSPNLEAWCMMRGVLC